MLTALLWIVLGIAAGIIALVVLFNAISMIFAILIDLGNIVWAFLFAGIVLVIVASC